MGVTTDLLVGLAEDSASIDGLTWDPDGPTGNIALGPLSPEAVTGLGLTPYSLAGDTTDSVTVQPVQFWIRGTEQFVRDVGDALFDRHHGAVNRTINGLTVTLTALNSDAPMGVDAHGMRERAMNFYFTYDRPSVYRPD